MEVTGDYLVSLLAKPEWDDELIDLFEHYDLKRLNPKKMFAGMEDVYIEDKHIELHFGTAPATKEQYDNLKAGNVWFNEIAFYKDAAMPLPFGLEFGNSYKACLEKISHNIVPMQRIKYDDMDILICIKNEITFAIYLRFTGSDRSSLKKVLIRVKNEDKKRKEKFAKNTKPYIAPLDEF
jgi:hypothetical protein